MTQDEWLKANAARFGSDYERLFASNVLSLVAGIRYESLSAQYPFKDNDGKQRYCDLVINEEGDVRIAIEIDGYDKSGTGTGMSHPEFVDWQRRQSALTSQGWRVLRFANRDVREHPQRCAREISVLLDAERKKAHDLLSSTRQSASVQQLAQAQGSRIKGLNKEVSVMKYTIMSFTALIAVLIVVFAFKGNESSAGPVLASSAVDTPLTDALSKVAIAPCWTLMLAYPQAVRPGLTTLGPQWNAARSTHHRIAWLARESSKPGRNVVERWTVQASPAWSAEHLEDDEARVQAKLIKAFAEVTGIRAAPAHADTRRWRYAQTTHPLGKSHLWDKSMGLGACGDWCLGHRVEDAFVSGLELALAVA